MIIHADVVVNAKKMKKIIAASLILFNSLMVFCQPSECGCYQGIGSEKNDTPILIATFNKGHVLSVCGFLNKSVSTNEVELSEFNVFNCNTGGSLVEFGALENCIVRFENSVLTIDKLSLLPAGDNWKWKYIIVGTQQLFEKGNDIVVTALIPNFKMVEIPQNRINSFFKEIELLKGKGYNDAFEEIIGKLEILSLDKNIQAYNILMDFDKYFGFKINGATREQLDEAISTINFVTNRNMH